ncbi:MAG: 50S ribosomal protein L32 [Candidatus Magasanikbacteria bacterium GW2011_GWC2_37_14]|uniref:Large ribosomal subunit protein bL32 n=1 Tax=Candidatus Magasanikbacteria bacterium GW2011_GWC2_37_14 TaxID=1619046 RepID=A0A0G0IU51_9BACT|nr:MAG: 50S ribosomal protein L32 [Candidatus Magasanikbacteria bacterium GW2011_GWC2_37_14]
MGLPAKQRTSRSRRERGSHFALKQTTSAKCSKCGANNLPHCACKACGNYKGRQAIPTAKRAARAARRKKTLGK